MIGYWGYVITVSQLLKSFAGALCLIRMSELYPHHRLITADKDFRVYRRNKREVIPLICPP
jgi:hypothetical protein